MLSGLSKARAIVKLHLH